MSQRSLESLRSFSKPNSRSTCLSLLSVTYLAFRTVPSPTSPILPISLSKPTALASDADSMTSIWGPVSIDGELLRRLYSRNDASTIHSETNPIMNLRISTTSFHRYGRYLFIRSCHLPEFFRIYSITSRTAPLPPGRVVT